MVSVPVELEVVEVPVRVIVPVPIFARANCVVVETLIRPNWPLKVVESLLKPTVSVPEVMLELKTKPAPLKEPKVVLRPLILRVVPLPTRLYSEKRDPALAAAIRMPP